MHSSLVTSQKSKETEETRWGNEGEEVFMYLDDKIRLGEKEMKCDFLTVWIITALSLSHLNPLLIGERSNTEAI